MRRYFWGDAAFASPDIYKFLEDEGFLYAIRLPKNQVLLEASAICSRDPLAVRRTMCGADYAGFSYRPKAGISATSPDVFAKVEWHHQRAVSPMVGVHRQRNLSRPCPESGDIGRNQSGAKRTQSHHRSASSRTQMDAR